MSAVDAIGIIDGAEGAKLGFPDRVEGEEGGLRGWSQMR